MRLFLSLYRSWGSIHQGTGNMEQWGSAREGIARESDVQRASFPVPSLHNLDTSRGRYHVHPRDPGSALGARCYPCFLYSASSCCVSPLTQGSPTRQLSSLLLPLGFLCLSPFLLCFRASSLHLGQAPVLSTENPYHPVTRG